MNRIGLKINGIWCVLPQDVSISIEEQNPLFSDSGSFSYPIEMSVSQNRELFKSIDSPHGRIRPQDLDGLPFELWYDGVMLLYGSTETDEDLDIEEDKCSVNLVSGNGDFQSKIDGMQCTDVPLMSDIYLGYYYPGMNGKAMDKEDLASTELTPFEALLEPSNNMEFLAYNVSSPFPVKPYCNIRVCVKRQDKETDMVSPYKVLDADRPWSGMCFYVAYFYQCLFQHLGYVVQEDHMGDVDDMYRLAFVTTKCEHRLGEKMAIGRVDRIVAGKYVEAELAYDDVKYEIDWAYKYPVYATEKNFPETDVSTVLESMFNAFGLKVIVDDKNNNVSIYYMRDLLRDNEVIEVPMRVIDRQISYSKVDGVKMTYSGDEDDTSFNYKDYDTEIKVIDDYQELMKTNLSPYDKRLYIVSRTGNKYRIKIDEDAEKEGDEKNLHPVLFEVGQFGDYIMGKDGENVEELKISFTPLIENDVRSRYLRYTSRDQTLALFVDGVEVKDSTSYGYRVIGGSKSGIFSNHTWWIDLHQECEINYTEEQDENPITSFDTGFMLGVMRGAGNKSGYAVELENYDGNGNDAWVTVEDEYATTSDTMDAYGNRYDYNGTVEGGVALQEDSISLKPHIYTAQDLELKDKDGNDLDWGIDGIAAKRGLADRFMSEYMYFLLHRKTVTMDVDTTLSQLTSLSWFKQYRICDTVGRLKSRSYTLKNSGVTDMSIELYTIN